MYRIGGTGTRTRVSRDSSRLYLTTETRLYFSSSLSSFPALSTRTPHRQNGPLVSLMGLWPLHSQTHSLISTSVSDSADPGHDEDNASTTELTTLHSLSFSRTNLSGKLSHHDDEREALKRHKKGKTSTPSTLHVLSESSCEVTKLYRQHTAGPADSHESGSHGSHDLSYELRESESSGSEDTLPLTPTGMSPRQSRYKPRSYVSPDADDLYHTATDERCRDGRTDKPPGSSGKY